MSSKYPLTRIQHRAANKVSALNTGSLSEAIRKSGRPCLMLLIVPHLDRLSRATLREKSTIQIL